MAGIAGKPNISWCETNQIETIRINVVGQLNIADCAHELDLHCTLLTSGVIYQYQASGKHALGSGVGYSETDVPNFKGN